MNNWELGGIRVDCKAGVCGTSFGGICLGEKRVVDFYSPDFFGKEHFFWGKGEYCDRAIEICRQHNWIMQ